MIHDDLKNINNIINGKTESNYSEDKKFANRALKLSFKEVPD